MAKMKILIVDDEEDFTALIKTNLEITGKYEVRAEHEGAKAMGAALAFGPDLILLDVMMPGVSGGEIAEKIKDDERTKNIPVVILTAAATGEEVRSRNGFIGGYPFIAKPVSIKTLKDYLEKKLYKI